MAPPVKVTIFKSVADAESAGFLSWLAAREKPWTFDIESYDGGDAEVRCTAKRTKNFVLPPDAEIPNRKNVSTNPHHADFRVRGVAIAISATVGYWLELNGDPAGQGRRLTPKGVEALCPAGFLHLGDAFGSGAEKTAFNGHFDENGMVFTGWVPAVRNRVRDPMLSMLALGDGTHERVTLEQGMLVLLKRQYHWNIDKSLMQHYPVETVADGAVHDACGALELGDLLDTWADEDRRILWSGMTLGNYPTGESPSEMATKLSTAALVETRGCPADDPRPYLLGEKGQQVVAKWLGLKSSTYVATQKGTKLAGTNDMTSLYHGRRIDVKTGVPYAAKWHARESNVLFVHVDGRTLRPLGGSTGEWVAARAVEPPTYMAPRICPKCKENTTPQPSSKCNWLLTPYEYTPKQIEDHIWTTERTAI
jgi:hypothetical protein